MFYCNTIFGILLATTIFQILYNLVPTTELNVYFLKYIVNCVYLLIPEYVFRIQKSQCKRPRNASKNYMLFCHLLSCMCTS